jgi:hypothetical protein
MSAMCSNMSAKMITTFGGYLKNGSQGTFAGAPMFKKKHQITCVYKIWIKK